MTPVGQRLADPWRPAAAALAVSCLIGRWGGGGGFGYTIFVLIWLPIGMAIASDSLIGRRAAGAWLSVVVAASLPWWLTEPAAAAGRLALLLLSASVLTTGVSQLLRRVPAISSVSTTVVAIGWLTWTWLPLLRADGLNPYLGDVWFGRLLGLNPILVANANSPTAADWTHGAVAYRWLTVLGQDVAFEWATGMHWILFVYFGIGLCCFGGSRLMFRP